MFKTFRKALEVEEIRKRLFYTFLMMIVVRIGCQIPTPGINIEMVQQWLTSLTASNSAFNFFNTITGSSFSTMSIFALSISPYITSSIIVQLLTIAIPKLEELSKEGEEGRKVINNITRFLTVGLALIQSVSMAIGFNANSYLSGDSWMLVVMIGVIMTGGSALLMWIGEQITDRGLGNGISVILLINIISSLPNDFRTLYEKFVSGQRLWLGIIIAVVILALLFGLVMFVVYLQDGERKLPVQYAQKVSGRKLIGGQASNIPIKVNTAGVIPVIFASSIMSLPGIVAGFMGVNVQTPTSVGGHIIKGLLQSNWCNFSEGEAIYSLGLLLYIGLLFFFAFFYTSITFNPLEVANNLKKQGGFIPGIRPGKPTSDFIEKVLNKIIFIGAVGLLIIAIIPIVLTGLVGIGSSLCFFGTSLIIIVGVVIETLKQAESMMVVRNYKGFLND